MAANRFATMLHRNGTHKLVLLLVYAVLEWVLILLLLLNSLFSYLITKFAIYFGLQKPCLWCSRVDHILEPGKHNKCFTDLLCESHAAEISQLGYCSNHRKLAESRNMCWDCLASRPSRNERLENGDESDLIRCCCCNESLSRKQEPDSYMLFRPSWGPLEYAQKADLVMEAVDDDENNNGGEFLGRRASHKLKNHESNSGEERDEAELVADCSFNSRDTMEDDCLSSSSMFICYEKEAMEDSKGGSFDIVRQGSNGSSEIVRQFSDVSIVRCLSEENDLIEDIQRSSSNDHRTCSLSHRLIPVELIDFSTQIDRGGSRLKEANLSENGDRQDENLCSESRISSQLLVSREATVFNMNESPEKKDNEEPGNLEMVMDLVDQSSLREADEGKQSSASKESEQVLTTPEVHALQINVKEAALVKQNELLAASEQERHFSADAIVSKTMVPTHASECAANQDNHSVSDKDVNICTDPGAFLAQDELGVKHTEKATEQGKTSSFEMNQESTEHSCIVLEPNEAKEDKLPDTPTSTDSLHHLDKKLLLSEKREPGAKESLDGSVISELEGGDGVTSIEQLKTALKSERKALSALYSELEEERSASAIAANQTMAMITRLQEEKAAMQMEALQYQRMMEEQSEYDQEALQLLNDLMVKREKEKQELEKELEEYRKKVLDYEEKEKMRMIRRLRDGSVRSRNSSASCSHAWDIEDLSIDLNRELRDEDNSSYGHQENNDNNITPADTVQNLEEIALDCVKHISILDDSLTEFEEERLSILDQLKALEEKLVKLGDEDEGFSNDLKMIADSSRSHVLDFEENQGTSRTTGENGVSDVFSNDNDCMERKMYMDSTAKKLLPLLDAAGDGDEGHFIDEEKIESKSVDTQNSQVSTFESDSNRVAIEEEVDHVYERLQALEADREFLKNCMSSVKKGDKGMDLLQEILQHLRDLKNIEVRMKSTNDDEALGEVALN
ncbi:Zein-binding domain containing protein [Trema orientale]|uniref:Zein-binding domain containing protein n=1 Tax=Trema orientale TaxID=63057 RepID=A0A2P5EU30_TREOI|nr:Zein-binding domain containing protein [Trema orientale]